MNRRQDTLLIVDDERFNINILKDLLEPDYDIMVAKNGTQALERATSSTRPDLVLLDIMMPGMDGYQVLARLKADNATLNIPVIFITALGDATDEEKGLKLGAVDYISKPFSPPIVQARINTHIALQWSLRRQSQLNTQLAQLNDALAAKNIELAHNNKELSVLNKRFKELASVDGLTGIPNRRCFEDYLRQEWREAIRSASPIAIILIDVDCFTSFNEHYGHEAGDDCLRQIAKALARMLANSDAMIARFRSAMFVCVLPTTNLEQATNVATQLRECVHELAIAHDYSPVAKRITISLGGAATVPSAYSSTNKFIDAATDKLGRAKELGRNQSLL